MTFDAPFSIKSAGRMIPAGTYEIVTDDELIEGLSFPVYRRVATFILVPGEGNHASTVEMLPVETAELEAARAPGLDTHSKT
jgi:hypothetical protein